MTASIIIPVYNGGRFLRDAVRSALRQRYRDIEIIIVNDGSRDKTAAIGTSLQAAYPDTVRYIAQSNAGASAARNTGLASCRGEYVQFLDVDDILASNALSQRILALDTLDCDVVTSQWQKCVENDAGQFMRRAKNRDTWQQFAGDIDTSLVQGYWCPPAAWTVRRRGTLSSLDFNTRLKMAEDVRFLLDAAIGGARFEHVPQCLAWHRVTRAPSLSRRSKVDFVRGVATNAIDIDFHWRMRGQLTAERKRALADVYDYVARTLYRGDPKLFQQVIVHLLAIRKMKLTWPAIVGYLSPMLGHVQAGRIADSLLAMKQRYTRLGAA